MGTKKLTGFAAYLKENKSMPVPLEEDISVADLWMDDDFEDAFADVVTTKARILYSELSKSIDKNDWMTPSKVLGDEKTFVSNVVNNTKDDTFTKKTSQFKNMIKDIEKKNVRPTKAYYAKAMSKFLMESKGRRLVESANKKDLLQASDLTSNINKISKMTISDLKDVNTTSGGLKFDEADFQGFEIENGNIVGIFKTKNDGRFSSDYFVIMNNEGELEGVSDY